MKKFVVLGAGGHAGVAVDLLESAMKRDSFGEIELLDDNILAGTVLFGKRVTGMISDCVRYPENTEFIIGIGDNRIRKSIAGQYALNYATLIHPGAVIGSRVELGKGTVVMAGAVINRGTRIGEHCIINTGATVDHECMIENFVHISPGAHLGGEVHIGEGSWMGIGSCVKNRVKISQNVTVGAGAAVIKDLERAGTYLGVPARLQE